MRMPQASRYPVQRPGRHLIHTGVGMKPHVALAILNEASVRGITPVDLLGDIIEAVASADLFTAVLDL